MFFSGKNGLDSKELGERSSSLIIYKATYTQEFTNERLMSITFNLASKSNAITFVVAYDPTDTVSNIREQKDAFWVDLDTAVRDQQ